MVLPPNTIHPAGETDFAEKRPLSTAIEVETFAGKVHVEWDPTAAVTPIGQLPFFIEFLKLGHRFNPWVETCPLHYVSNNAPQKVDATVTGPTAKTTSMKRKTNGAGVALSPNSFKPVKSWPAWWH